MSSWRGIMTKATSGAPVSKADMRVMLRNLLIERFHLATHWEEKTQAIFHLTVLSGGPKMKTADAGFAVPNSPMRDGNTMQLKGPMSMPQLAERLSAQAGRLRRRRASSPRCFRRRWRTNSV